MKVKFLIPIVLGIALGFIVGKIFFNNYKESSITVFQEGEKVYFIQNEHSKDKIESKDMLVLSNENGYYLYSGITKDKDIAEKIKDYYKDSANNLLIEEKYINNYSFLTVLNEYDKIAKVATNLDDLISIENIVISNYKEMVLEGGFKN